MHLVIPPLVVHFLQMPFNGTNVPESAVFIHVSPEQQELLFGSHEEFLEIQELSLETIIGCTYEYEGYAYP